MLGKKKCKLLREIRQRIASENDIPYVTEECEYKGECKGTCPKCESELAYLEAQLEKRRKRGLKVTASAVAIGLVTSLAGCASGRTTEGDVADPAFDGDKTSAADVSADPSETGDENLSGRERTEGLVAETEPETEPEEFVLMGEIAETEPETEPEQFVLEGDVAYEPTQANNANG